MMMETPYVHYEVREALLIATYKKGVRIDLSVARQIVRDRLALTDGRPKVALVYNLGVISMDKEARDFLSSPAGNRGLQAGAIVLDSPYSIALSNFFLRVNKPNIPSRIFRDTGAALAWLQPFLEELQTADNG